MYQSRTFQANVEETSSMSMHMLGRHQCWRDISSALQMIILSEKMHFGLEYCVSKPKKWFKFRHRQQKEPIFDKIFPLMRGVTSTLRNIGPKGVGFLEAFQQVQVTIPKYNRLRFLETFHIQTCFLGISGAARLACRTVSRTGCRAVLCRLCHESSNCKRIFNTGQGEA